MGTTQYWMVGIIPALAAWGLWRGDATLLATPIFVFGCIPIADAFVGRGLHAPAENLSTAARLNLPLLSWVPVQLAIVVYALERAGTIATPWWIFAPLAVGIMTGAGGINIAHELVHRRSRGHRALGEILLHTVAYPHFAIEHVHGHHRHVATTRDPASARRGLSLYRFLPRSILGGLRSAIEIERERAKKRKIAAWSLRHRLTRFALVQACILTAISLTWGASGVAMWLGQAGVAVVLLEAINYIEHYGLCRRRVGAGFERVAPHHSWNSNHRLTNWLLFNLPLHSDHHYDARRPYGALRHHEDAPQLPAGYATMILCAFVPPLWFRIMHPRLDAIAMAQPR